MNRCHWSVMCCAAFLSTLGGCRSGGGDGGGGGGGDSSRLEDYFDLKVQEADFECGCSSESPSEHEQCLEGWWAEGGSSFFLIGEIEEIYLIDEEGIDGPRCARGLYQRFQSAYDQALDCGMAAAERYVGCLVAAGCDREPEWGECFDILSDAEVGGCAETVWEAEDSEDFEAALIDLGCDYY